MKVKALAAQSCLTLWTPWTVACQAPQSIGILQAGILQWVAIPFSRGFSWPSNWKLNIHVLYYPATVFLDIYPKEMKAYFWHKNFYTDVISTFICNSPKWNNPDVLQLNVQLNQPCTPWDTMLQCKETEYWYTQLGWTSSVLWWMKKVSTSHLLYDHICITF